MGVSFFNPSKSGGSATNPKFLLFQNQIEEIPANQRIYFWFGGNRHNAIITDPPNQFAYWTSGGLNFIIEKIFIYHSPIFNAEDVDVNLVDSTGTIIASLGTLSGILPSQLSILTPNVSVTSGTTYEIEIMNHQVGNVFTPYQITAVCQKI